jgi:6-phosphogluconolactonase
MKIARRFFVALPLFFSLAFPAFAQSTSNHTYTVLVGTYTDKTASKGIYAFDFDASTGKLTPQGLAAETPNPSWVAVHPNDKWVYAANESGKQSTISAFSVDPTSGKLTLVNQLPSEGEDPCYLSFDKTGKYLFVANYTSGTVAVFPILDDGKLGAPTSVVKDSGTLGPNKERQDGPHAHWVQVSADNRFVFLADLGLDRILVYRFDSAKGTLAPNNPFFRPLDAGAGPRHAVFASDEAHFYVLCEMNSTVSEFAYVSNRGILGYLGAVHLLPPDFQGRNDAAEIAIHPSGKWLFASNRGHDSIAVFAIDPQKGTLASAGDFPTGGKEPRHFVLDPTGQFLLAENQNSNNIVVFRIDPATGALTQVSKTENVSSPVCLTFLPAATPAP